MRATYTLTTTKGAVIPWDYQHLITSALYKGMGKDGDTLHDSSKYKHFCFALTVRKRKTAAAGIELLDGTATLRVSSPKRDTFDMLTKAIAAGMELRDIKFSVKLDSVDSDLKSVDENTVYSAVTPVVAVNGRRIVDPTSDDYIVTLTESIRRKAEDLGFSGTGSIEVVDLPKNVLVRTFNNSPVKGSIFRFVTDFPPAAMSAIVDSGLGAKCSQGFGFLEVGGRNG
jgi:CRISPR-associated endoribonuclease Cas6